MVVAAQISYDAAIALAFGAAFLTWLIWRKSETLNRMDKVELFRNIARLKDPGQPNPSQEELDLQQQLERQFLERTKEIEFHSMIVRTMAEGICLIKAADGMIAYANPKFASMFGYEIGELEGQHVSIVDYNDLSGEIAGDLMAKIIEKGEHSYEVHNVKKDGTPFWCHATSTMFDHPTYGQVIVAVQEDISSWKEAEIALVTSERMFRSVFESAYDSILIIDRDGRIERTNDQLGKKFGYSAEELVGQPVEVLIPERYRKVHSLGFANYVKDPHSGTLGGGIQLYGLKKDGSEFPIDISLSTSKNSDGFRMTAIIRDITSQKRHEDEQSFLVETAKILQDTMDYQERIQRFADAIVPRIADTCSIRVVEGGKLRLDTAAIRGRPRTDLLAQLEELPYSGRVSAETVLRTKKAALAEDLARELAVPNVDPNFRKITENLNATSLLVVPMLVSGEVIGVLTLSTTTSGRRFTVQDMAFMEIVAGRCAVTIHNARLYHQAKEAIADRESILSIVSHDLKNPLSTIHLTAQLLTRKELSHQELVVLAERLNKSSIAANRLVQDLQDFGKIESGSFTVDKQLVDASVAVDYVLDCLSLRAKEKQIELAIDTSRNLPEIPGDRDRIVQVLWNLVGNAIKFSPEGGTVVTSVDRHGDSVLFSVTDNGPGIEPADLPKVFDRFWQAKKTASEGSGLGLAIAKGIVEAHGGKLWAESVPGERTSFYFTIPISNHFSSSDGASYLPST